MYQRKLLLVLTLLLIADSMSSQNVDLSTLLREMTFRVHLPEFPAPAYTCAQMSSYDRRAVDPSDTRTWFFNADASWFLRTEKRDGRTEHVLFDAAGPGAVVRFWATMANYDSRGVMRFYFDGEPMPRIEGEPRALLSGEKLVRYPLSFSVSELSPYDRRGHNLYLPIPYSKSLKITYESANIKPGALSPEKFYYQINYRTYPAGTAVESFSMEGLAAARELVEQTCDMLWHRNRGLDGIKTVPVRLDCTLAPAGDASNFRLQGKSGAIRKLTMQLRADGLAQALRSTVLEISFDGENRVWAPIGDFFGTGYTVRPSRSWYTEVTESGQMTCWWIMPFRDECVIRLKNYGTQRVEVVNAVAETSPWTWNANAMHFCSVWRQLTKVRTRTDSPENSFGAMDVNFATIKGRGVWVGDGLALFNTVPKWWGEGDEKIYVDGEKFPSHFGTGSEDYYGYAWCRPEPFLHPFIQQPDGAGNFSKDRFEMAIGTTLNARYRVLDAIPFRTGLRFDMELWHWSPSVMNYAPMSYFYLAPGGAIENQPDIEGVKAPVAHSRNYFYDPVPDKDGRIACADMRVERVSGGSVRMATFPREGRARDLILLWDGTGVNDRLNVGFDVPEAGKYRISVCYVDESGAPQAEVLLGGKTVTHIAPAKDSPTEMLGGLYKTKTTVATEITLPANRATLEFRITGGGKEKTGLMLSHILLIKI